MPPWSTGRRRRRPPLVLMKKDWFWSFFSGFPVETVHYCDCCSEVWSEFHRCISAWFVQWEIPVFLVSLILLRGLAVRVVFLCQLIHCDALLLSPANYWVANHDLLDLVGNDREFHSNSFWYISSWRYELWSAPSVRLFCRAEHRGVSPSWWRSAGWREHPVAIDQHFDWIRFQPRDVHKCNRSLLDSNKEGILSIALSELFRITRITSHYPNSRIISFESSLNGCRRFFAANRLEVLLDEDDSRSSSRVREHGSFLLVSQLHVAIQTLWSQCLFPREVSSTSRGAEPLDIQPTIEEIAAAHRGDHDIECGKLKERRAPTLLRSKGFRS